MITEFLSSGRAVVVVCLGRDLSLVGDELVPVLPVMACLAGDLSPCLGGEQRGEVLHIDQLEEEWLSECQLEFLCLPD